MPNFIKGDLRMRGSENDLLRFLNDGLDGEYIKETHRGFVTDYGLVERYIEVIDGIVLNDNVIKYENYKWECDNPTIGG